MSGQHWNGFAILGNGYFVKAWIIDNRVVDTNYLTCAWAGKQQFHDWLDRQVGITHWSTGRRQKARPRRVERVGL